MPSIDGGWPHEQDIVKADVDPFAFVAEHNEPQSQDVVADQQARMRADDEDDSPIGDIVQESAPQPSPDTTKQADAPELDRSEPVVDDKPELRQSEAREDQRTEMARSAGRAAVSENHTVVETPTPPKEGRDTSDQRHEELSQWEEPTPQPQEKKHTVPPHIDAGFTKVREALDKPRLHLSPDEQRALSGGEEVDAVTLGLVAEVLETQKEARDQEQRAKEAEIRAAYEGTTEPSSTQLAERIAKDRSVLERLVDEAETKPSGIRGAAVEARESKNVSDRLTLVLDEADQLPRRQGRELVAEGVDKILREARDNKEWTVDWFNTQFTQYEREGVSGEFKGLWGAMRRQPEEAGLDGDKQYTYWQKSRHDRAVNKMHRLDHYTDRANGLSAIYKLQENFEREWSYGELTESDGHKRGWEPTREMLWGYRIRPLDSMYCKEHPEALASPMTLERAMRVAAVFYRPKLGVSVQREQDGTIDIMKTADGLKIDALDRVITMMEKREQLQWHRQNRAAYAGGERPAGIHPDILKLHALRIALSSQFELIHNGENAAMKSFIEQVEEVSRKQAAMEGAAGYAQNMEAFLRGDLDHPTDGQIRRMAEEIAARYRFMRATVRGGDEERKEGMRKAQQYRADAITALGDALRGREVTQQHRVRPEMSSDHVGGIPAEVLAQLSTQELEAMYAQVRADIVKEHAPYHTSPSEDDPLAIAMRKLNGLLSVRLDRGGKVEDAKRMLDALASDEEWERQYPSEERVLIASGQRGNAAPFAALVAANGGTVRQVTTEGLSLSNAVRRFCYDLSKEGNGMKAIHFPEQESTPRRDMEHGLIIGTGWGPPPGMDPQQWLDRISKDGLSIMPLRNGSGWSRFASATMALINQPNNTDKYVVERVGSANITISPFNFDEGDDMGALVIAKTGSKTYERLLARNGANNG